MKTRCSSIVLAVALAACSSANPIVLQQAPNIDQPAKAAPKSVYAFSSGSTTTLARFPLDANGATDPTWKLAGRKTQLQQGHGIAMGSNGALYVMSGSPGQPLRLLKFGAGKKGNTAPSAEYRFPSTLLVDYTEGLAIDRAGTLWVSDAPGGKIRGFVAKGRQLVEVAAFAPELNTTSGRQQGLPHAIFVTGWYSLYCWVSYLYHGFGEIGVTEYDVRRPHHPRMVRSFFDPGFPDIPPDSMTIDGSGYLYAANTLNLYGVRVYPPVWKARQGPIRIIGAYQHKRGYELGFIASLASLSNGTLYVAVGNSDGTGSSIVVYPPGATGDPKPAQIITNPQFIQYSESNYGGLLLIR